MAHLDEFTPGSRLDGRTAWSDALDEREGTFPVSARTKHPCLYGVGLVDSREAVRR